MNRNFLRTGLLALQFPPTTSKRVNRERLTEALSAFQGSQDQLSMNEGPNDGYEIGEIFDAIKPDIGWLPLLADLDDVRPRHVSDDMEAYFQDVAAVFVAEWLRLNPAKTEFFLLRWLDSQQRRPFGLRALAHYTFLGHYALPENLRTRVAELAGEVAGMTDDDAQQLLVCLVGAGGSDFAEILRAIRVRLPVSFVKTWSELDDFFATH